MSLGEGAGLAAARSRIYWLLSRFYVARPSAESLTEMAAWLAPLGQATGLESDLAPLRAATRRAHEPAYVEDLARQYTRLLRGIAEAYGPPPPYESLHRREYAPGEVTAEVAARMAEAGYRTPVPEAGPPDHIGAELAFLSLLCYGEEQAWEEGAGAEVAACRDRQRAFLGGHLIEWVPRYCREVLAPEAGPLYAAVARLTARFVTEEHELLARLETESAA